jgi:hypothetical protein
MKIHPDVTQDMVMDAVEREMFGLDNPGFCMSCGNEQEGCEPDAREYECEACGEKQVYGAAELLLHIV